MMNLQPATLDPRLFRIVHTDGRAKPRQPRQDVEVCERVCREERHDLHPNRAVTEAVVNGLAVHVDELGKPLCPCNFYQDKQAEAKLRRWICACDEMQIYKYCHCLLFVREDGMPITEYLPEDHEGRQVYGLVTDPSPDKGRALRHKATPQTLTQPQTDQTVMRDP